MTLLATLLVIVVASYMTYPFVRAWMEYENKSPHETRRYDNESLRETQYSNEVITITDRTVRFGKTVYQTRNIASFSEGNVPIGQIPGSLLIVAFIGGILLSGYGSTTSIFSSRSDTDVASLVGAGLIIMSILGFIWNIIKPTKYGLLLTLNSGDKKLFATSDRAGMKQVISTLYDFIEEDRNTTYQITVGYNQISGNLIQGNVSGSVSYRSGN
ncbi:MAG: hypothetical protein HC860_12585 [Alkalinema sp. RU_4_3]|nr:hypothetical protein [Alkalinema sp. RU_4_3]